MGARVAELGEGLCRDDKIIIKLILSSLHFLLLPSCKDNLLRPHVFLAQRQFVKLDAPWHLFAELLQIDWVDSAHDPDVPCAVHLVLSHLRSTYIHTYL